jgi:hypothetical protein
MLGIKHVHPNGPTDASAALRNGVRIHGNRRYRAKRQEPT